MKSSKEMVEAVFARPYCNKCRVKLTPEQMAKARKLNFLPLCDPCDIIIREALKKCLPLMQKLKL
jgi:NAD-dependent SIR2 family protein deacetylase